MVRRGKKPGFPRKRNRPLGSAALVAMVLVILLSGAIGMVHGTVGLDILSFREDARRAELQALSDAAVAASLAGLSRDDGFAGLAPRPFGNGRIESCVLGSGAAREILTIARVDGDEQRLRASVALSDGGPRVIAWEYVPPGGAPLSVDGGVDSGQKVVVPKEVE